MRRQLNNHPFRNFLCKLVFAYIFTFESKKQSCLQVNGFGVSIAAASSSTTAMSSCPERKNPEPELFSIAPMMGHTHRHYRNYFGMISQRAWLYTEMIPAGRVVRSFCAASIGKSEAAKVAIDSAELLDVDWVLEQADRIRSIHQTAGLACDQTLEELLDPGPNNAILQLGGRDPIQLANAAAIGAAFGYQGINLNCGCPSTSVSARATGASLMQEPSVVASCLEAMSHQMEQIDSSTILSVKHRLGVKDAQTYDANSDHAKDDQEAYDTCSSFVRSITAASKVSRIQVHARIALLGLGGPSIKNDEKEIVTVPSSNLWTPTDNSSSRAEGNGSGVQTKETSKVNHQRIQYQAKRQARQVTLQNRSVPPLRPGVVEQIAQDFPNLHVTSNGGIDTMEEIRRRGILDHRSPVAGAMVGRAAINHPCAFAAVDRNLYGHELLFTTRRQVLSSYIGYCEHQDRVLHDVLGMQVNDVRGQWRREEDSIAWHRRRLVAPAFHLFMGEDGNQAFQRRLRKLVGRADRHPAHSMLMAAMAEISSDSLDKPLEDHVPWNSIPKYDFIKRSGAMQRTIH